MKPYIVLILILALTLPACDSSQEKQAQKNYKSFSFRVVCIDGLSYLAYHGSFITNFQQIYIPAKNPANPPQPKTCEATQ